MLLAGGQALGLAADRFILHDDRAGFRGGFKCRLLLLEPEPRRAGVALQLGGPCVQFGLAMVQLFLPLTQMFRELPGLAFHVPADGRRIGRQRLAPQHFQIDTQVGMGCFAESRAAWRSAGGGVGHIDAGFGD